MRSLDALATMIHPASLEQLDDARRGSADGTCTGCGATERGGLADPVGRVCTDCVLGADDDARAWLEEVHAADVAAIDARAVRVLKGAPRGAR